MRSDASHATKALNSGYIKIRTALHAIAAEEGLQSVKNVVDAEGLLSNMKQLEFRILTEQWSSVLERFSATSSALQSPRLDLNDAIPMI